MEKGKINIRSVLMFSFIIAISLFQLTILHNSKLDSDILWHYKLGEEIIKTGEITSVNNFTFLEGTEWIHQEWLYEVLLYCIIAIGGLVGFFGLCVLNSIVMWTLTSKDKNNLILFSIISAVLIYITPRNVGNRPSEFSIYLLLAIIYLYNKDMKNIKEIIYFALGILVANFHGGSILVTIAIWMIMIANDIFNDIYNKTKINIKYYARKTLEVIVFMLGTLLNPSGVKLLSTIVEIPNLETTQYILEWKPAEVSYLLGIVLLSIIISFGYYIGKYGIIREDLQLMLINTALLILSLHSRKAFMIFDIVWMMYGYKYLEIMLHDIFNGKFNRFDKVIKFMKSTIPAGIILIALIGIWTFDTDADSFESYVNSFKNSDILTELKKEYIKEGRILASYSNGNYLIYNDIQCFVDTRQWPYVKELSECEALDELFYITNNLHDSRYISEFIDKYSFNYIWTDNSLDLNSYLENSNEFELVVNTDNEKESLWRRVE